MSEEKKKVDVFGEMKQRYDGIEPQYENAFRREYLCELPSAKARVDDGGRSAHYLKDRARAQGGDCPMCDRERAEIRAAQEAYEGARGYAAMSEAYSRLMDLAKKYPMHAVMISHQKRRSPDRPISKGEIDASFDAIHYAGTDATFFNQRPDPSTESISKQERRIGGGIEAAMDLMTVGQVKEQFFGVSDGSSDPMFDYRYAPPPPVDHLAILQQLVKALEAGNYNVPPSELMQGRPLKIESVEPIVEKAMKGVLQVTAQVQLPEPLTYVSLGAWVPQIGDRAQTLKEQARMDARAAEICECGAHKTHHAERGSALHSSWCPWSKP